MRFIHIYLLVYAALIAGALYTLYRSNVLQRLPAVWTVGMVLVATGLGLLVLLLFRRPQGAERDAGD